MTTYEVSHRTAYDYGAPVALSQHLLHLEPRPHPHQQLLAHDLAVAPMPGWSDRRQDVFNNPARVFTIDREHRTLVIDARSTVAVTAPPRLDPATTPAWEDLRATCLAGRESGALGAARFAFASPFTPAGDAIETFARASFTAGRPVLDAALALNRAIHEGFIFDPTATSVATPVRTVLAQRRGVCQDFAHLMLASLRALMLPARYVSGYLLTRPPPGRERLVGADASHAWVALWVPDHGWVDLDPTNGLVVGDEHITLAWGRDYGDVSPVAGVVYGGGAHAVEVAVDVVPLAAPAAGED